MIFHDFWVFLLLPFILVLLFYNWKKNKRPGIRFSSKIFLREIKPTFKLKLYQNLIFLRMLSLAFIITALARPQSPIKGTKIRTEGIDIVLAIDVSTSMKAEDFRIGGKRENRLEVVKDVIKNFIKGRKNDRIGIVAFAGRAYTVCPLTLDYGWILSNLERIKIGMIEDGTAIGDGIASSLNRLKDTKAKGKVIILLTDGRNNAGEISPLVAAEASRALNVKIYTIGAGTKGLAPYPVKDFFGNTVYQSIRIDLDENTLKKIASTTHGKYYRATDTKSLREIYKEIDKLEKTPIVEKGYTEYKELFPIFLIIGLSLLLLEITLDNIVFRRVP